MGDEETLVGEMERVLEDMDAPPKKRDAKARAPDPEPEPEPERPSDLSSVTGFPNPLGLELTSCHLPKTLLKDKVAHCEYVRRHLDTRTIGKVSPSPNERKLYAEYVKLTRPNRPLTPRWFAASVRLIVAGKPILEPEEDTFDTLAL